MKENTIPTRNNVKKEDCWDLSTLFNSVEEWESALESIAPLSEKIMHYKNTLATENNLLEALKAYEEVSLVCEKVGNYAFLLTTQDAGDADSQDKMGRFMMAYSTMDAKLSFFIPEIQAISSEKMNDFIAQDDFITYRIFLQKLLHLKPYILSEKEERIFALQTESMETPDKAFSMLTNVDMDFGTIKTDDGEIPLSQASFSSFLINPDREIRKEAYDKFYKMFDSHKNTIATLYTGSVNQDIYIARARGYNSAIEKELFKDKVPLSVYDNLVATIRANLAPLHKYYGLVKKVLNVDELRHYDVYVPLTKNVQFITSYEKAVDMLAEAFAPLGSEYVETITTGLRSGWVDKYENKGKRSGAFSAGGYVGYPYILMNYKDDVIRDVFTLAHEGGHSMHSYYSAKNNPFMHYNYTIFEAEVASTFNEQLLFEYLLKNAKNTQEKAYLLCIRASDILATLYRQTMFAEYEQKTHALVESGTPLSVDVCRTIYKELLEAYFGSEMHFEETSDLECLRIPHFYNAFYVYKYATGISAALALAKRVTTGGDKEREEYFNFLKAGGSHYPIENLRLAGVDMEKTDAVQAACDTFANIVDELESLLG